MPFNRYEPDPSGGIRFHDDGAGASFVSFGPAAQAQALQLDAAAAAAGGPAVRPVDFYQGLGRPPSMATSPEAVADARGAVQAQLFGQPGAPPAPPPVTADAPAQSNASGLPPIGAPPTLSAPPPARAVGAIGSGGGGDVGRVQEQLGVAPVPDAPFLAPMSAGGAGALALRENKGGVDPTTAKFQTFSGPSVAPSAVTTGRLGTGDALLDQLNAEAMQPARFARTPGGWSPQSRTTKREATPDTESFHRFGAATQGLAQVQAEGAEKRAENEQKQADVLEALVPDEQARIAQTTRNVDEYRVRTQKAVADVDSDRKRLAEAKVDPAHFFSSMSAGQEILQILSIFAGAMGQAMTGGRSNVAVDAINRLVEQDVAAQRDNIEQGNRNLSASERRVDLEAKQLGSMETALDLQRARAYQAAQAKAKQLEAQAKSDAERQSARELIAATDAKLYELNMKFNAARNGDQVYSEAYRAPGVARVGGYTTDQKLKVVGANVDQAKANAQVAKDAKAGAPQTVFYGGKRIALRPEIGDAEAAKSRDRLALLHALEVNGKRLNELNTIKGKLSPSQAAEQASLRESLGADWSTLRGQGVVNDAQAERFETGLSGLISGKGGVEGLLESSRPIADGIVRQSGAGYMNADGSIQPFSE